MKARRFLDVRRIGANALRNCVLFSQNLSRAPDRGWQHQDFIAELYSCSPYILLIHENSVRIVCTIRTVGRIHSDKKRTNLIDEERTAHFKSWKRNQSNKWLRVCTAQRLFKWKRRLADHSLLREIYLCQQYLPKVWLSHIVAGSWNGHWSWKVQWALFMLLNSLSSSMLSCCIPCYFCCGIYCYKVLTTFNAALLGSGSCQNFCLLCCFPKS